MQEAQEVHVAPVEAGGDAPEVLELVEAALDAVACAVKRGVVGDGHLAVALGRDDRLHAEGGEQRTQGVGVVGAVGDGAFGANAFEQGGCARNLGGLARREQQAQGPPERIAQQVDLGGQSSSGTPQRLVFVAPFLPVAAC